MPWCIFPFWWGTTGKYFLIWFPCSAQFHVDHSLHEYATWSSIGNRIKMELYLGVWDECRLPLKYNHRPLPCLSFPYKLYILYISIPVVWIYRKFLLCQLNILLFLAITHPVPLGLFLMAILLAHRLLIQWPEWAAICSCPLCDLTSELQYLFSPLPFFIVCALFFPITSLCFECQSALF